MDFDPENYRMIKRGIFATLGEEFDNAKSCIHSTSGCRGLADF